MDAQTQYKMDIVHSGMDSWKTCVFNTNKRKTWTTIYNWHVPKNLMFHLLIHCLIKIESLIIIISTIGSFWCPYMKLVLSKSPRVSFENFIGFLIL